MTSEPDAAPERPATTTEPAVLPPAEHRAIDAAVAGVAGLLVGRALFGRGGGLVAGLAAVGAGLLAKRRPGTPPQQPVSSPLNNFPPAAEATPPAVLTPAALTPAFLTPDPVTRVTLETGTGTIDDGWATVPAAARPDELAPLTAGEEISEATATDGNELTLEARFESEPDIAAESPEDAGAFAEMPALFESTAPPAAIQPAFVPEPDISHTAPGPVVFDDSPAPADVNVVPVAQLVNPANGMLEKEALDTALSGGPKGPPTNLFGLLDNLPAEFAAIKEEEEPGPREDFLLIPDQSIATVATGPVPPIQSVVAALNESREPFAAPDLESVAPLSRGFAASPEAEAKEDELTSEKTPPVTAGPPVSSPFALWATPSALTTQVALPFPSEAPGPAPAVPDSVVPSVPKVPVPATSPVEGVTPVLPPVAPALPPPPAFPAEPTALARHAPDPEEIWRQAAAELTALRNAPARTFPPSPEPLAEVEPLAPAFPPLPLLPAMPDPAPIAGAAPAASLADPSVPPWLRAAQLDAPLAASPAGPAGPASPAIPAGPAAHDPSRDKAFLPTIKLTVPQGPQPLTARRPIPLPPDDVSPAGPTPVPHAVAPVALQGYRAEPVVPALPPMTPRPAPDFDAPLQPLSALPMPKAAAATAGIPAAVPPSMAAAMPPPLVAASPGPLSILDGGERVFVPRVASRRHTPEPHKRRLVTPLRVALLVIAAAAGLGVAYRSELKEFWDQKVLGKLPAKTREWTLPRPTEPVSAPGDGSGVTIAPDPPPSKSTPPDSPGPGPSSRPAPPAGTSPEAAPVPSPPGDTPPVPDNAQPAAEPVPVIIPPPPPGPEATGPIPVSEAGARELISRLIHATTAAGVKPYILDAGRIAPTLASYFSSGRAVPVASYESLLERADKSSVTGRTMWLFRITTDNVPRGFPLAVEDTREGLRTDWELFAQCRDGALQAFLANPSAPPGLYFAALKRAHVFADMLPGKDHTQFFAFEISSPALGGASVNAFIPKGTPLAARADALYKFSTPPYAPLLELTHKDGHVEITGIMRENWRTASGTGNR